MLPVVSFRSLYLVFHSLCCRQNHLLSPSLPLSLSQPRSALAIPTLFTSRIYVSSPSVATASVGMGFGPFEIDWVCGGAAGISACAYVPAALSTLLASALEGLGVATGAATTLGAVVSAEALLDYQHSAGGAAIVTVIGTLASAIAVCGGEFTSRGLSCSS